MHVAHNYVLSTDLFFTKEITNNMLLHKLLTIKRKREKCELEEEEEEGTEENQNERKL